MGSQPTRSEKSTPHRVAALYKFVAVDEPAVLRAALAEECRTGGILGTLIVAPEGLNGTVAGTPAAVDRLISFLRADPRFIDIDVKYADASEPPFARLKVKEKREIVTLGVPEANPTAHVGDYVEPTDWNALIARDDVTVIDTRNDYEVAIGTFRGAVDPKTNAFTDLPAWAEENLPADRDAPIAMFCTGGIRCEKSTALLKARGYRNVFHLKGGILRYLEEVPEEQSLWEGDCFVFDERVSVGHGLIEGDHVLCRGCGRPVDPQGRADPVYVEGVCCPACHDTLSPAQKSRFAERQKQHRLARERGEKHLAADLAAAKERKRSTS